MKFRKDCRSRLFNAVETGYSTVTEDSYSLPERIPVCHPNLSIDCLIEPIWRFQIILPPKSFHPLISPRWGQTKSGWVKGRIGKIPQRERFGDFVSEGTHLESMSTQTLCSPEICSITKWYSYRWLAHPEISPLCAVGNGHYDQRHTTSCDDQWIFGIPFLQPGSDVNDQLPASLEKLLSRLCCT